MPSIAQPETFRSLNKTGTSCGYIHPDFLTTYKPDSLHVGFELSMARTLNRLLPTDLIPALPSSQADAGAVHACTDAPKTEDGGTMEEAFLHLLASPVFLGVFADKHA